MPNHCEQDLYVKGPREEIDRLIALVAEGKEALSANKVIPYPEYWAKLDAEHEAARKAGKWLEGKDGFNSGGYDWCIKHWGSKWGAYESSVKKTARGCTFKYQSAWGPITPVIEELSRQFPKLTFDLRYFEQGMAFQGAIVFQRGRRIIETEGEYHGTRGG